MAELLRYAFIQNAFVSGALIAAVGAMTGYFLLARGLTFAGHALPNVGFAGAAGAVLVGVRPVYGMFVFTILAGLGIGALGRNSSSRDTSIGVLMTFALGMGLLFLDLYSGYAQRVYSILFGTILGISRADVEVTAITAAIALLFVLAAFRPLVFSTFDPAAAEARGVPTRLIANVLLVMTAVTVSISIQVMGAILVFTLIVGPAATAMRLFHKPLTTMLLAALLGVLYVWGGILLAAASGDLPVSFFVSAFALLGYLPARLLTARSGGARPAAGVIS